MAKSPSHKFGQMVGELLEDIMTDKFQAFCDARGLYLDKKGPRGRVRKGKKVSWEDNFGNKHDLDFVIEKGGDVNIQGRPLAFIEAAWRRYTKHSRNKAQEIQGAILPIADKYQTDKPFLGVILAGEFTRGSLSQMESSGFKVALFPYKSILNAFKSLRINAAFDERTPDREFKKVVTQIKNLNIAQRTQLKQSLLQSNKRLLDKFFSKLAAVIDRNIEKVIVIPLHGHQNEFATIGEAVSFVNGYHEEGSRDGGFRKYEIIVRYNNGDKIDASFREKQGVVDFLRYIAG